MKSMLNSITIAIMLLLLSPVTVEAWGRTGHKIVAEVALQRLSKHARKKVSRILKNMSPDQIGNWMDDMRSDTAYKYMEHWHYIDYAKDSVYRPGQDDNIVAALQMAFHDLDKKRPKKQQRKQDLLMIFHLMGDMHQPLHTGYPEDKGGNTIKVDFNGNVVNLHHLWDVDIVKNQHITLDSVLATGDRMPQDVVNAYLRGNFVSWMEDSRTHLPEVYNFSGNKIDKAYMERNGQLVKTQLFLAGARLAKVLELLFD